MINKVILIGHLGADPEMRYTSDGKGVANIRIATSESWKDKNGEKQTATEWHKVVLCNKLAEIVGEYLNKGSKVYIEGKLQTKEWQDKEDNKRYTTQIVAHTMKMLGGGGGGSSSGKSSSHPPNHAPR